MDNAFEQAYREREKRLTDAIQLRTPDRVPITLGLSYFPAKLTGTRASAAYYDFPAWKDAYVKAARFCEADRYLVNFSQAGPVLEAIDSRQMKWPGHGVSEYHTHQFVEGEYMKAEEYDLLLNDTSDFLIRFYLPRLYGALGPTAILPPLNSLIGSLPFQALADEQFVEMLEKLTKVARQAIEWQKQFATLQEELTGLGYFCPMPLPGIGAPFDVVSDFLRGMRGTMLDMYRCPDKLLRACEMFTRIMLERIAVAPTPAGLAPVFMPLHRGAHGFMSLEQFKTFYWPYLKKVSEALIAKGYTPDLFFEGDYNSRLECLAELPKGKTIARFDQINMRKAKEILGKTVCIAGNMPVSVLQVGTAEEVKQAARSIIDVAAKDGGYIMMPASALDEVKPENMKTWIEFTKEYGRYQ